MNIRVKPDTVQLPHKLTRGNKEYLLAPSAEVPDDYGQALIKTHPNVFELSEGPDPDLKLYKFKEDFKKQSISDIVSKLDDNGKLQVFNFATSVLEGNESPGPVGLSPDAVTLANSFESLPGDLKKKVLTYVAKIQSGK